MQTRLVLGFSINSWLRSPVVSENSICPAFKLPPGSNSAAIRLTARDIPAPCQTELRFNASELRSPPASSRSRSYAPVAGCPSLPETPTSALNTTNSDSCSHRSKKCRSKSYSQRIHNRLKLSHSHLNRISGHYERSDVDCHSL